ncbi:ROK family transcriptional regulator [Psychromonas ossibalaenae]|uniref:ROK family transcriptional regulator n=1 Tax=Psychromonas ossibalaenae TaxID=444922 RepID=UPI000377B5FC|nr:ROK family transcriptional regulator [Psychromonas ossibalaenae]
MVDFGSKTQRTIFSLIHSSAPVTRAELAELSGLTPPAITTITKKMLDEGLLVVLGRQKSARGQPGIELGINHQAAYSLGINIELEKISIEIVDLGGSAFFSRSISGIYNCPEKGLSELFSLLEMVKISYPEQFSALIGAGITTSCNFNQSSGQLRLPPYFKEWESVDFQEQISEYLQLPAWVENDGTAAALGEHIRNCKSKQANLFYLYLGYGVGGGHFYNDTSYRGYRGNAGRIGRLFPHNKSRPSLNDLYQKLGLHEPSPHRYQALEVLVEKHQEIISHWLNDASEDLVNAIQTIHALIDPEEIVLGGLLPAALLNELYLLTVNKLNEHEEDVLMPTVSLATVSGDQAAATGAALIPLYKSVYQ